jgi:hypothetical protein
METVTETNQTETNVKDLPDWVRVCFSPDQLTYLDEFKFTRITDGFIVKYAEDTYIIMKCPITQRIFVQ